jgi:pyruvate formate lyase activating enzyme
MESLSAATILAAHTEPGELYLPLSDGAVQCTACAFRCKIGNDASGVCRVRFNKSGTLFVPAGYVSSLAMDPIEKKPFFHVLPGSTTLSFGMLGCDYHCSFCQNWTISQTGRDDDASAELQEISAAHIIRIAQQHGSGIITSTYNEPLITTEWAVNIFRLAKEADIKTAYVSNGNATPEALEYLRPWIDFYKVDLKAFRQAAYTEVGGKLRTVLDTITALHQMGIWEEVVTLLIPGLNDSDEELREMAAFLASVSPDIPWHVTAYHDEYRMEAEHAYTPPATLIRAAEIGYNAGLHFVYAGNATGQTRNYENTYCPHCKTLLIKRDGFRIVQQNMLHGACPSCSNILAGCWE